jgi:hypothetical protein
MQADYILPNFTAGQGLNGNYSKIPDTVALITGQQLLHLLNCEIRSWQSIGELSYEEVLRYYCPLLIISRMKNEKYQTCIISKKVQFFLLWIQPEKTVNFHIYTNS